MLRDIIQGKRSILFTWLLYYGLILLVPVLIIVITYFQTARVVENEITNSNKLHLKRVQQQMDLLLTDAARLSNEIVLDTQINNLLTVKNINDLNPFEIYKIVQKLRTYKILNGSIDDFYIYFKNIDLVLCSDTSSDKQLFYDIYLNKSGFSYHQWQSMVSGNYRGNSIPVHYENADGETGKTIAFIKTIPYFDQGNNSANIVITLNESRFMEDFKDIGSMNRGTALILDQNNRIMASSGQIKTVRNLKYKKLSDEDGVFHQYLGGEKYAISFITSGVSDWKYLVVTPNSVFWEKAEYVRNLTLTGLALCILMGGMISYYALRRNYNPVLQLIQLLEKYQGLSFDKNHNEYSFIQQAIDKAHAELEKVDGILEQQNKALRSHFLTRLLTGKEEDPDLVADRLAMYNIHFRSDFFAVMAFYIEDFVPSEQATANHSEGALLENFKKVQSMVAGTVEGLLGDQIYGLMTDVNDMLVCLVNFTAEQAGNGKTEMVRIAGAIQRMLAEEYHINILVSASNVHQTALGIPEAFNETLQAMEYKKLLGIEDIVLFEELNELPKGDYYYPLEKEHQLINCIKAGDSERSKVILDEVFQNNFQKAILPVKIARCLMFNLVSTMMKTINAISDAGHQDFIEELNPVERLLNCETINEMKAEMIRLLETFCDYIRNKNKERNRNRAKESNSLLQEKVSEFILNRYQDPNLGIMTIAEQFKVHPVYLSRIFLEQTGTGLLDFINQVRLKQAKPLFKQLQNLDEVARAVGYSSTRTFTRAFKKYEGVTPGKYKDTEPDQVALDA